MNLIHRVGAINQLNEDTFLMTIEAPEIAATGKPGQFVNVKCGGTDAYLRRPFSLCRIDRERGTFDIGVQIRGRGTEALSRFCENNPIDIIGPLGNGFSLNREDRRIAVVGGGIGVFPLLQLLREHPASEKLTLLGFRNRNQVVLEQSFQKESNEIAIATDDGSYGARGFVTALLERKLEERPIDRVFICGPTPMMKHAVEICKAKSIPCEVSLEERMGCGIGACLVCACKVRLSDDWDYAHVCKDGPVFSGESVVFQE
jgi:dihydroorotate dehydrogenase electron transfer subunit